MREREFSQSKLLAVCWGTASEESAHRWWCTLGLWDQNLLKPEESGTRSCSAAGEEEEPRFAWQRWVSAFVLPFSASSADGGHMERSAVIPQCLCEILKEMEEP